MGEKLRLSFGWVVDRSIAGCSRPGSSGAPLADDLKFLKNQNVGAIVSITEEPLDTGSVAEAGFNYMHASCAEGRPPANAQLRQLCDFIEDQRAKGRRVAVHCLAGFGRTMTAMAAHLIASEGISSDAAIRRIHDNRMGPGRPSPIGISQAQASALHDFADWIQREA